MLFVLGYVIEIGCDRGTFRLKIRQASQVIVKRGQYLSNYVPNQSGLAVTVPGGLQLRI